ncbi:uroporphyrinogen-III synthase-like [Leguminivora glycinivorella]|uniref:uroporphyrinogen-III synthase-like n=1 Tax=Leguminivora glycinivorella TaxID=1035111 RepID=UPI00200F2C1E|nr:uroporphyrinogen-III synthase-like [Leguminivora glycinivorella]
MKKVVLFKGASEEYERAFREHNYETIFVEPLQFTCVNLEALGTALRGEYAGLVLTSARAAEAVARCWDPARFVAWSARRVYTVGDATAHKIKLLLGLEALGATAGNAENLAKVIVKENDSSSKFLFPCGNLRSETLPTILQSKGIAVDSLTVYETKENDNLKANLMELDGSTHDPCCMVFFSPSGCEYIHRQLQTFSNRLTDLPYFAIGNSTAHKIENLGVEIAGVAEKPRAESVIESVQKYFAASTSS